MIVRSRSFRCVIALLLGFITALCIAGFEQTDSGATILAGRKTSSQTTTFVFRTRVDEVNMLFTVVDRKGRFVRDLKKEDLQLLDNRRPPARINEFQQQTNLPLRVALVVDTSGSVTPRFKYEQEAAIEFFKKILRPSMDKALVVGFDNQVHLQQDLTNDVSNLESAVMRLKPNGETALYEAVVFAADRLRKESEHGTRKIIILISDGESNSGRPLMTDAEHAALRAEAPVYCLSTNNPQDGYTKGEAVLDLLSRYTGGEVLPARERSQVTHAFRQVEEALRSQYILAYKPADFAPDGQYRSVSLTARDRKLRVECRRGYFAPKE